jgi:hypothetical protein
LFSWEEVETSLVYLGYQYRLLYAIIYSICKYLRVTANQRVQLGEQLLEIVCRARLLPGRRTLRPTDNSLRPSCELIYAESSLRNFRTPLRLCRGINQRRLVAGCRARQLCGVSCDDAPNLTGWLRGASLTSSAPRPPEFLFGKQTGTWSDFSPKLAQSHQKFMAKLACMCGEARRSGG